MSNTGVVAIGRNEGERLRKCLTSIRDNGIEAFVYVDSGSTDDSLEIAESLGAKIVFLDTSIPFSAGRARNEGFRELIAAYPDLEFVQFLDGDCVLETGWLKQGQDYLMDNSSYVIACGQRKEMFPERTLYNRLCDMEWNTPIGEADACGGDFIVRVASFGEVGGFNPRVIAGEEPDLCYRLRQRGGRIRRLDYVMTRHDAAMTKFSQWWKRAKRAGHAYAQGYDLHRADHLGYYGNDVKKIILWALLMPLAVILTGLLVHPLFFVGFTLYPVRFVKIYLYLAGRFGSSMGTLAYAFFISIAQWPQLSGVFLYYRRKWRKADIRIIEHK